MIKKLLLLPLALLLFGISDGQSVTTYAGGGSSGSSDGLVKANFTFALPYGVTIDHNGNMYISDMAANLVYIIYQGKVYARAGGGVQYSGFVQGTGVGYDDQTNGPGSMVADANNNIYFIDYYNNAIRKLSALNSIGAAQDDSIIAGVSGNAPANHPYYFDTVGLDAVFFQPTGLALDPTGKDYLYVADAGNSAIRKIDLRDPKHHVTTVVGSIDPNTSAGAYGYKDGAVSTALFYNPLALTVTANGDIYVADGNYANGSLIRKISGGQVSTITGSSGQFYYPTLTSVLLNSIGHIFIADGCDIKKDSAGYVAVFAGDKKDMTCSLVNGTGTNARFNNIGQMCFSADQKTLYVADTSNHVIRAVTIPDGTTTAVENAPVIKELALYPNPAGNNIVITGEDGEAIVCIYDVTGKQVMQKQVTFTGNEYQLALDHFSNGYYSIKIQAGDHISAGKFIISK